MNFRYDINGLRAIAVIAVVLFHFNPAWVPGGFAGVDIFFVISGFLMTGIIFRGLENDNFNLFKFYVARANRIIPALAVLCLVLLVFGWFYLTPLDYKALGKHVASSMGFLSNVIYWRESGYFDAASHEKWLLHTWSLSVEWQFYIMYPIVLVVLKRFLSLDNVKRFIIIGTVLGFVLSVVATIKWPNPAYYLLPTRAWEMMMGGVAFLYPWNVYDTKKKLLEASGLLLILASYAFVSSDVPWPGHFALIPVLGSYLIIVANRQSSVITNNKVFQCLGKWSYSIYLWHWPVVVFGYYFDIKNWYLYGLPLSVALGFASFKFIERLKFKPFSKWIDVLKIKSVYMVLILGVVSSYIWGKDGVSLRLNDPELYEEWRSSYIYPQRENGYCMYDLKRNPVSKERGVSCISGDEENMSRTILFGDSYAGHYDPMWDYLFKSVNRGYRSISTHVCHPSLKESFYKEGISDVSIRHKAKEQCLINRKYLINEIELGEVSSIILAGSWNHYYHKAPFVIDELYGFVDYALSKKINVIIVASPYMYNRNISHLAEKCIVSGKCDDYTKFEMSESYNNQPLLDLKKYSDKNGVIFLDRNDLFNDKPTFYFGGKKVPYSLDGGHISLQASLQVAKNLQDKKVYNELLKLIHN